MDFLYHCFPRMEKNASDPEANHARGFLILELILKMGIILVPERIRWNFTNTLRAGGKQGIHGQFVLLQRRFCLTSIDQDELLPHCALFGSYAIEMSLESARDLGATPVFYIA